MHAFFALYLYRIMQPTFLSPNPSPKQRNVNLSGKTIRWGIIGCGDVTEVKSGPPYQQVEGFELAAVMRRDPEKLADYAKRHGVEKTYTDPQALIDDPGIDAVYIATPPDSHREYAVKVAAAGKPCCVEKPLSPSYEDSLAIYEAFEAAGVPLFVAYYRRSLPRFEQVKQWLDTGRIGTVRHVSWQLNKVASETDLSGKPNWRTDADVAPGGYFDDLASHGLDLFAWLLGEMQTINGISLNQQGLYTARDAFAASWQHQGGITGTGSWNFGCASGLDRVEIFGSVGRIEFSVFDEKPVVFEAGKDREEKFIDHPHHVQMPHVENMAKHLLGKGYTHSSMGRSGLHTSWMMDRIIAHH